MHYYKRNLGDYAKKAGRLSMLQHGAYTLLIDACYDREQFPTFDEAIEWTWASTTEEIEAVTFVLRKFFVLEQGVYVQKRIQEELADYLGKAEINKRIAIERETKRKERITVRAQTVDESTPNQEPITKNQEPSKGAGDRFEKFWKSYPRKQGKGAAEKAWIKAHINGSFDSVLTALESQKQSEQWKKDNGQFVPNPATWLNQRRWEDEIPGGNHSDGTSSTNDIFRGVL